MGQTPCLSPALVSGCLLSHLRWVDGRCAIGDRRWASDTQAFSSSELLASVAHSPDGSEWKRLRQR